jgi:hypothetical protein
MMPRRLFHDHRPVCLDDNRRGEVLLRYPLRGNVCTGDYERSNRRLVKWLNGRLVKWRDNNRHSRRDGKRRGRRGYSDPEARVLRLGCEREHSQCYSRQ